MNNIIDMKSFENMVESSTIGEFNDIILTLKDKKIDESHGRVERFNMKNMGNFYENTVENYLKELSSVKPLKEEEVLELLKKIKDGDSESREILIEGLLKLVAKIALRYAKVGASYIELVQEGLMGIVTAIEKYEFEFNMKFTEYLEFWIKYAMVQSNKKVVDELKSPIVTYFKHLKVEVYKNNNKELVEFDKEDIKKVLNMELEEFENLEKINEYGFLIKEEDREQLEEYKSIPQLDKELEKVERLMLVSNLANKFTNEEIKMLDMYYGLSGKRKFFEDIGKVMEMDANKVKTEIDKLMVKLKYNGKREWIDEN